MGLCRICGKNYGAFGNNGVPLINGMVCDSCNGEVVGFRMKIGMEKITNQDLVDALAEAQVAKIQLGIEKKKNEVAKNCIKTLGDTAKKYKAELDEIAQEECVMPMIDRIMEDANNDVKKVQDELDAMEKDRDEQKGYRVAHLRIQELAAESLFYECCEDSIDEFMEDDTDHKTLQIGICRPNRMGEIQKGILKVSNEDEEAHYKSERLSLANICAKYARAYIQDIYQAEHLYEITDPIPCPHCENCKSFHMDIRMRPNANNID